MCGMLFTYCSVFHDKFASLRQVNSPNSQDKFQMCYTEAFGVHDFWNLNFAGFCRFLFCHSTNIMKTIKKKEIERMDLTMARRPEGNYGACIN